jgi:hypothetical protein
MSNFIKSLSQSSLIGGGTKSREPSEVPVGGEVKLTTFSTNADLAIEMEAHPLLKLLKANKNDLIFRALTERHVRIFN